jgi:hypothetical protein
MGKTAIHVEIEKFRVQYKKQYAQWNKEIHSRVGAINADAAAIYCKLSVVKACKI